MTVEFTVSDIIPASPQEIYRSWLDSLKHSKMTGSPAEASDKENGDFTAWDGYIQGKNIKLVPFSRIVQLWRTSEFENTDPDSDLEISFEQAEEGTLVIIRHSNLPAHGMQYQQGWIDAYFIPMKEFFG